MQGIKNKKENVRTRNDPDSRNFTCGCGKSYLSYAALYTHIKTKHDGIPPTGTSQPNNNGKPGRGRPKKDDSAVKHKDDDKSDDETIDPGKNLTDFLDFLQKLGATTRYDNQNLKENENAITSSNSKFDPVKCFPTDVFLSVEKDKDYSVILAELGTIRKQGANALQEEIDQNTELKKTKLNRIFAIFLNQMAPYLKEEFYRELCVFITLYRKSMNEQGWDIRSSVSGKNAEAREMKNEFCEVNNGEYAPDVCNEFITETMPKYLQTIDQRNFKVIGQTTENTRNAVFLTQYLCNWLNANRYTNSRLSINPDGGQT